MEGLKLYIITIGIIIMTSLLSYQTMFDVNAKRKFMFNAYAIRHRGEWWRFFTNGVLHADWIHLLFNMLTLYSMGRFVEAYMVLKFQPFGHIIFLAFYLTAIAASSVWDYFEHKDNSLYNSLGASGAISAIMFAAILIAPTAKVFYGLPLWIFGILYLVYSTWMARSGRDNIGHSAHFWGSIYGLVFMGAISFELVTTFILRIKSGS
jgi:membrane associated rhomboid family serine protease